MVLLRKGGPIRLGDKLIHGGRVIHVRYPNSSGYGQGIATRGDIAHCEKHGGYFPFIEACYGRNIYGSGIVLEGHKLACGCYAISSCASSFMISDWLPNGLGAAVIQAYAEGKAPHPESRWAPPALPGYYFTPDGAEAHPLIALRIGLFFDGTANNSSNAMLGEQCRAIPASDAERRTLSGCKAYMETDNSYQNTPSNIARLYDLYEDSARQESEAIRSGDTYYLRHYIEGAGTRAGETDSLLDMGTGTGHTGVMDRVGETLTLQLNRALRTFTDQHKDVWVTDILFDVFGFSRGATAARFAINLIQQGHRGPLATAISTSTMNLAPGFDWTQHIRVSFAGLYDTVAHIGSISGDPSVLAQTNGMDICLREGCAETVVHLTARDECRVNFPLTSTSPPWRDIPLPGAHADVGGGYHEADGMEDILLTRPVTSQEFQSTPLEKSKAWRDAAKHLALLQQRYPPLADKLDVYAWAVGNPPSGTPGSLRLTRDALMERFGGSVQTVGAAIRLRRAIRDEYALVTLRIMHSLAQDKGVPFDFIDDNDPTYRLPDELQPIATSLLAYARGGTYALTQDQEQLLAVHYLHHSANWNMLVSDNPEPTALYYVDRPTDDGKRVIYPNQKVSI
jgi:uncharacterized Zn-binding protein involved in type VI secretion